MDYFFKIQSLGEEKLLEEIKKINDKLFKMSPESAMYNQLVDMREMAQTAYQEQMEVKRIKKEDAVLNIGDIESTVVTPDYSKQDLLNAVVTAYTSTHKDNS